MQLLRFSTHIASTKTRPLSCYTCVHATSVMGSLRLVGVRGFEPPATASQTQGSDQAELHTV